MDPFIGEIRLMSFPFAPKGWMYCQGQMLPISQNQALYSLLGTTYGGDGKVTFGLPDLRGRVAIGTGTMPGSSTFVQGQTGGTESVALTQPQMPTHDHTFTGTLQTATTAEFSQASGAFPATGTVTQFSTGTPNATLGSSLPDTLSSVGNSQPHENRQPLIVLNYAIATQGIYPSRG